MKTIKNFLISHKNNLKQYIIGAILLLIILASFIFLYCKETFNDQLGVSTRSDGFGYYCYLPAIFIHGDIKMHFVKNFLEDPITPYWIFKELPNGGYFDKYYVGTAILMLPPFLIAHVLALIFIPQEANGFSMIYQVFLQINALIWLMFGLVMTYLTIKKYASKSSTIFSIFLILLGTPLIHYSLYGCACYSHVYIFTLSTLFIYLTIKIKKDRYQHTSLLMFIGAIYGLLITCRITNVIFIFIYLFFDVYSYKTLKERFKSIFQLKRVLIPLLCALSIFSFQIIYVTATLGRFTLNTYTIVIEWEGFHLAEPHFGHTLVYPERGIFLYCPIILILLILAIISHKTKTFHISFFMVFISFVLYAAFWVPGCFGKGYTIRPVVDYSYIYIYFLALGLDTIKQQKNYIKLPTYSIIGISVLWNMFMLSSFVMGTLPQEYISIQNIINTIIHPWFIRN